MKNNSEAFEFNEHEVIFFITLTKVTVRYEDIISYKKANYFRVCLRSLNLFKPLFSLPLGVSWYGVIIEAKTKSIAVMLNNCDDFILKLENFLQKSRSTTPSL